ncbi:hypothetical protein QVD17_39856 [Tagetes erecta]|uniref:NLP1-9 GAF domain-containing protein n=1 Tax=Tagetes erecta TaxID=13708 RepID=A0AAD8JT78_TARER|nr:hypothetical protein QVD17_39856 [Tagetes erecta]
MYRLHSQEIHYHVDENGLDIEYDPMIVSGGPATAFLNRFPYVDQKGGKISIMLPICLPFDTYCVGVLEFTMYARGYDLGRFVFDAIERADLDVCNVQEQIPYKTINGLRDAKDEIKHALEIVGGLHSLSLAQVWIACKDKCHMALPFYLASAPKFGLKLTGYLHDEHLDDKHNKFGMYNRLCDVMPLGSWENFVVKTLQDYKSRYMVGFRSNMLINWEGCYSSCCAFTICLRCINTDDTTMHLNSCGSNIQTPISCWSPYR